MLVNFNYFFERKKFTAISLKLIFLKRSLIIYTWLHHASFGTKTSWFRLFLTTGCEGWRSKLNFYFVKSKQPIRKNLKMLFFTMHRIRVSHKKVNEFSNSENLRHWRHQFNFLFNSLILNFSQRIFDRCILSDGSVTCSSS